MSAVPFFLHSRLGLIPIGLFVWALLDVLRSKRSRWWIAVVIVPVLGPIAYVVLSRAPGMAAIEMDGADRKTANRHLARLEGQLATWRGPAVLAEAGEQLLILGRLVEAETRLREAKAAGADASDVDYPLARTLAAQRRFAEAVPFLDEILATEPDHAMGEARALLGACLDEAGDHERAEAELRRCLERRNVPAVKLRYARLLLRRGQKDEAMRLAAEFRGETKGLSATMRRALAPWAPIARKLEAGKDTEMPQVSAMALARQRVALWIVATVLIAVVICALVVMYVARHQDDEERENAAWSRRPVATEAHAARSQSHAARAS